MDELLRNAAAVLVDAESISNLSGSGLKCGVYYHNLLELINKYKYKKNNTLLGKLKSAMFEDTGDETKASKDLADYTYLLQNCIKCKCANCVSISSSCVCNSCVYGSYVTSCDGNKRVHKTDPEVIHIDGYTDVALSFDMDSGKMVATASDRLGVERVVKI